MNGRRSKYGKGRCYRTDGRDWVDVKEHSFTSTMRVNGGEPMKVCSFCGYTPEWKR